MRRAFLHIGLPKTGTTSIQAALANSRTELARLGVFWPQSALNRRGIAHHGVALEMISGEESGATTALLAELESRLSEFHSAVISSEGLANLLVKNRHRKLVDFASRLQGLGLDVTVVIAFRQFCHFIESMYLQGLRTGQVRGGWHTYGETSVRWLKGVFEGLEVLRRASVVDKIVVLDQRGGDMLSQFSKTIGLRPDGLVSPMGSENPRMGLKLASVAEFILFSPKGAVAGTALATSTLQHVLKSIERSPIWSDDTRHYRLTPVDQEATWLADLKAHAPDWLLAKIPACFERDRDYSWTTLGLERLSVEEQREVRLRLERARSSLT